MLPFTRFSRYFIELARQGSLRKAAEVLHVSASAIDRQLLLAEEELGMALFERLPSGLRLTSAGELLLHDLRRWHKDYARTLERLGELQGLRRGHVSLALIGALSSGPVARTIARIGTDYPGLNFSLRFQENREIVALVGAAEVDFGLMLATDAVQGVELRPLLRIPLGVAMLPAHPLAQEVQLAFGKTMGHRHIVAAAPLMIHPQVASLYAQHQLPAQQAIECNDVRMICSLVREGAGIAVLSYLDVADEVARGQLVFVPLNPRQVRPVQLSLCVAPQRQLSRAAQWAMAEMTQAFQGLELP